MDHKSDEGSAAESDPQQSTAETTVPQEQPEQSAAGASGATALDSGGEPAATSESWPYSWLIAVTLLCAVGVAVGVQISRQGSAPSPEPAQSPPPPESPATPPAPARTPGEVLLVARDIEIPHSGACVGRDGKAHAANEKRSPEICHIPIGQGALVVETTRARRQSELLLDLQTVGPSPFPLLHALIVDIPPEHEPVWHATNEIFGNRATLLLRAVDQAPVKVSKVRLMQLSPAFRPTAVAPPRPDGEHEAPPKAEPGAPQQQDRPQPPADQDEAAGKRPPAAKSPAKP